MKLVLFNKLGLGSTSKMYLEETCVVNKTNMHLDETCDVSLIVKRLVGGSFRLKDLSRAVFT